MLDMVNQFRAGQTDSEPCYWDPSDNYPIYRYDLSPLQYSYELEQIALQRAAEIAITYDHTRPDGTTCWTAYGNYLSNALLHRHQHHCNSHPTLQEGHRFLRYWPALPQSGLCCNHR